MKFLVMACLGAGALGAVGCADGGGLPTSPSASSALTAPGNKGADRPVVDPSLSASPRSGDLHVTKECSGYTGAAGSFCAITSSNLKGIEIGSKILYLQPDLLFTPSGSEVILDLPGPGNNRAFGQCSLDFGVCTFSGGTGKFNGFQATVDVTHNADFSLWYWEGTFSFRAQD
jgi:hypothetical protein